MILRFFYLILITLTSCVARYEKHGYMFDAYQTNLLQKNVSSKRTVLDYLGSPTIYFKLNNKEHFLYFSEEIKYFLFFKPADPATGQTGKTARFTGQSSEN